MDRTTFFTLERMIDEALPSQLIEADIWRTLQQIGESVQITLEEGEITVPIATPIAIVTRVLFREHYDMVYKSGYRVQVAIGGVESERNGILYARFCFATLYYTTDSQLITIDFHTDMR